LFIVLRFQTSYNNCLKEAGTPQQLFTQLIFKNWWHVSHLERVVRHSSWWIRGQSFGHNWRTIAVYNQSCQVLSTWCLEQKWYLRVRLWNLWLQTTVYCYSQRLIHELRAYSVPIWCDVAYNEKWTALDTKIPGRKVKWFPKYINISETK
jgi:hypothetical protein